ncbi:MAG: hypothetical protein Q4A27_01955 [bacterium]|nr:hypothetical protein [bacterium]
MSQKDLLVELCSLDKHSRKDREKFFEKLEESEFFEEIYSMFGAKTYDAMKNYSLFGSNITPNIRKRINLVLARASNEFKKPQNSKKEPESDESQNAKLVRKIEELRAEVIALNEENGSLFKFKKQAENLLFEKAQLQEEISKIIFEKSNLETKNSELKNQIFELNTKIKELHDSYKIQKSNEVEKLQSELEIEKQKTEVLTAALSNIRGIVNSKKLEKIFNPDSEQQEVQAPKSKIVLKNSNRFSSPVKVFRFQPVSREPLKIKKGTEIRLRNWRTPRSVQRKIVAKSPSSPSESLQNALSNRDKSAMTDLKICIIREKKPEQMAEIVKLFGEGSEHIQPYLVNYKHSDFIADVEKDKFDIFVVFTDSSRHYFAEEFWFARNQNKILVFGSADEKDFENRSRVSKQLIIIRKILNFATANKLIFTKKPS